MDYNSSLQFPTNDNFVNRVIEAEFTDSKKGHFMIHWKAEVVSPDAVEIDDKQVNIAGVITDQYLVTSFVENGTVNEEKSQQNRERYLKMLADCGQDNTKVDWNNPDVTWLKTAVLRTAMGCDVEPYRKTPTPDQKTKGEQGDPIINPVTKKPKIMYKPKITDVWCLADAATVGATTGNKPY